MTKLLTSLLASAAALALVLSLGIASPAMAAPGGAKGPNPAAPGQQKDKPEKVDVCHDTGEGFVLLSVSVNSAHDGGPKHPTDIVPFAGPPRCVE